MKTTHKENTEIKVQTSGKILQDIKTDLWMCNVESLGRRFHAFEQSAHNSLDKEVQFYYHLLSASFYPDACTQAFIYSKDDNYWQEFWSCIAFLKLGDIDGALVLLPRIITFKCPYGNVMLLKAISDLAQWHKSGIEYYHRDSLHYLERATAEGLNELLRPLWNAADAMLKGNKNTDIKSRFFFDVTLRPTFTFTINDEANTPMS